MDVFAVGHAFGLIAVLSRRCRKQIAIIWKKYWLAVHQIITITVSLIMVIAALITTLVLKNCCAQSGTGRHNSHQRKVHQQEESCQNLTDFTPARVPSKVDIFTAYNDSLQCSHECMRTAVPIYTDEMIQQTPVYKSSYNGNRSGSRSPADQLQKALFTTSPCTPQTSPDPTSGGFEELLEADSELNCVYEHCADNAIMCHNLGRKDGTVEEDKAEKEKKKTERCS
ncbi:hypothetical protein CRUP_034688 [Coryphaenoides rupestris]|nr:hypothetical protein CRUP_034688 [Coryphaenoides rupestris]